MPLNGPIQKMAARFDSAFHQAGVEDADPDHARAGRQSSEPLESGDPLEVSYSLPVGDEEMPLNPCIGERIRLKYRGSIHCIYCGRLTSKSFNQGYCYPCFTGLARCDMCIVKPEQCHYHQGTCREPQWGEANCMKEHSVYLANSSGIKVGISRGQHPIARWIDQGASQGLVFRSVPSRLDAGKVEVAFKRHVSDRTDWRKMLREEPSAVDLERERDGLWDLVRKDDATDDPDELPGHAVPDARPVTIRYPVLKYPDKVTAFNLDKKPLAEGTLQGIKGQYLILDTGVINVRKYAGYVIQVDVAGSVG